MEPAAFRLLPLWAALSLLPAANLGAQPAATPMVIHEWGTFTSLQDDAGHAIGGINTDDEPVPKFVHRLADFLLLSPTEAPNIFFQGAPRCHPDVTMRLETPVLYFHPAKSQSIVQGINVSARFRGGWLSEYYPGAEAKAPGVGTNMIGFGPLRPDAFSFGPLLASTVGSLDWKNLTVGGAWDVPATTDHVWTSPRAVEAASVRTTSGEAEKFLFYRGVAHIEAPIAITQNEDSAELTLRSQCPPQITAHGPLTVKSLWLVDISESGRVAFRALPPVTLDGSAKTLAKTSSHFAASDYRDAKRESLKKCLRDALVADGLFNDEAQALLNTWELSYFKSAGLRVFFLVPRAWTDYYLPLTVSLPSEITRTMVGRIELVTPDQRNHLRQIGRLALQDITNGAIDIKKDYYDRIEAKLKESKQPELGQVETGRESLAEFGVSVPKSYQLYLALGRFRNALILEEEKKRPAPGLEGFITTYNLAGYRQVQLSDGNGAP